MPRRQVVVEHDALNFLFFTESLQFLRLALSDQGGRVLLSDRDDQRRNDFAAHGGNQAFQFFQPGLDPRLIVALESESQCHRPLRTFSSRFDVLHMMPRRFLRPSPDSSDGQV